MNFKKYVSVFLCLILTMSLLAACGSSEEGNNNQDVPTSTVTEAPSDTPTETPTFTPEPTATSTPTPVAEPTMDDCTLEDYLGVWYMQSGEIEGEEFDVRDEGIYSTLTVSNTPSVDYYRAFWWQMIEDGDDESSPLDYKQIEAVFTPATTEEYSNLCFKLPANEGGEDELVVCSLNSDKDELIFDHYFFYDGNIPVCSMHTFTREEITIKDIAPKFYQDAEFVPYVIGTDYNNGFDDEGYNTWSVQVPYVSIYEGYEEIDSAISDAVSTFTSDLKKYGIKTSEDLAGMKEVYADDIVYFDESILSVMRSDTKVFSGLLSTSAYFGGVHPDTFVTSYNFSGNSGVLLVLDDIVEDKEKLKEILVEKITNEYPDASFFGLEGTIESEVNDGSIKFVVCNDNVSFYFSPYDIASYADGIISTSLPYSEYSDILYKDYFTGPKSFSLVMNPNVTYYLDFDNDGDIDKFAFYESLNEYGDINSIIFTVNDENILEQELEIPSYDVKEFFMRTDDGKSFIYLETTHSSEDYTIYGLEYTKDGINYIGQVAESFAGYSVVADNWVSNADEGDQDWVWVSIAFDPKNVVLSETTDLLGTGYLLYNARVDSDGSLSQKENEKFYSSLSNLILKTDLEVEKLTMNLSPTNEFVTLPAGDILYPAVLTDETVVSFLLGDGSYVRCNMADKDVFEIFDGLSFAD